MNRKRIFTFLITVGMIAIMTLEGFAFDIDSLKDKLKKISGNQNEVEKAIKNNEEKQKDITQKIRGLETTIQKLEGEIKSINGNIVETKNKIGITEKELAQAEENISYKKGIFNSRLNAMYKNGNVGYIEVLLNANDFTDLLTRVDMVKKIFKHDVDLLKYLKEQRDLIKEKKTTLENKRAELLRLMNNQKNKQQSLEVSRGQMQRVKKDLEKNHEALEKEEDKLENLANKLKKEILRKQSSANYVGGTMIWPAPGYGRGSVTSPFGYRIHPILRKRKLHTGIDIGVPSGTNIVASQTGKVIHSAWLGGYGKVIMLDHGGGIVTLYAHNSKLLVKEGQMVEKGQKIAKSGSTGMSTGPHLHFEVRENGQYVDPLIKYLMK